MTAAPHGLDSAAAGLHTDGVAGRHCSLSGYGMHMGAVAIASYVHWVCVQACLNKNPKDRPSAEELLHHDWLVRQLEAETAGIPEVRPYHSVLILITAQPHVVFSMIRNNIDTH